MFNSFGFDSKLLTNVFTQNSTEYYHCTRDRVFIGYDSYKLNRSVKVVGGTPPRNAFSFAHNLTFEATIPSGPHGVTILDSNESGDFLFTTTGQKKTLSLHTLIGNSWFEIDTIDVTLIESNALGNVNFGKCNGSGEYFLLMFEMVNDNKTKCVIFFKRDGTDLVYLNKFYLNISEDNGRITSTPIMDLAISDDGTTAGVLLETDNPNISRFFGFKRTSNVWSQQGNYSFLGTPLVGYTNFAISQKGDFFYTKRHSLGSELLYSIPYNGSSFNTPTVIKTYNNVYDTFGHGVRHGYERLVVRSNNDDSFDSLVKINGVWVQDPEQFSSSASAGFPIFSKTCDSCTSRYYVNGSPNYIRQFLF